LLSSLWEEERGQKHAAHFGKKEGGQQHAAHFEKSEESPFLSPCIYSPQSVLGCLGVIPRLSVSPFLVILGWFLFLFSTRIGRSNSIFF
jgi:hypothetical protein